MNYIEGVARTNHCVDDIWARANPIRSKAKLGPSRDGPSRKAGRSLIPQSNPGVRQITAPRRETQEQNSASSHSSCFILGSTFEIA